MLGLMDTIPADSIGKKRVDMVIKLSTSLTYCKPVTYVTLAIRQFIWEDSKPSETWKQLQSMPEKKLRTYNYVEDNTHTVTIHVLATRINPG